MEDLIDDLVEKFVLARKNRQLSVPQTAALLSIPKDRIYKWEQGNASPKSEDRQKIARFIRTTEWKNVPYETSESSTSKTLSDHEKYVALLESTNRTLEKSIQLSLNAVLENQRMMQAMLKTAVQNGEDLLADNGRKLEKVKEETNRRNAANFQALSAAHTGAGTSGKD